MKIQIPFRVDTDDAMTAVQAALEQAEQRIGELQIARTAKIEQAEGSDFLSDVAKLDREIAILRANVAVYQERLIALKRRQHERDIAQREQLKTTGIADVRKRLNKRLEAARKLDAAKAQVTLAFDELIMAEEEAFDNFPPGVTPLGRLGHFRLEAIDQLSTRRMKRPPSAGLARCFAEHEPFNFADDVEIRNREVIEMLESAPAESEDAA